ncbi:hypothetical protein ACXYX3_17785 [Mycobacterium sp. C3-094]
MTTDIIDRIDQLVDESLAAGEPAGGYEDWNPEPDPDYPRCPHCGRHWHGLPITARIVDMYARRWYDPGYEYASDASPVLCDGSDFIGPRRPPPTYPSRKRGPLVSGIITVDIDTSGWQAAMARLREAIESVGAQATAFFTAYSQTWEPVWTFTAGSYRLPEQSAPRCLRTPITIEFGPQNWHHEIQRPHLQFPRATWLLTPLEVEVRNLWPVLTTPDIPTPPRSGYDFTAWATDDHPTTGPQQTGWTAANTSRRRPATARGRNDKRSRR